MKKLLPVLLVLVMMFIIMPQLSSPASALGEAPALPTRTTTLDLYDDAALAALAGEAGVTASGGVYANAAQCWSYDTNTTPKTLTLSGAHIHAADAAAATYGIRLPADSKIILADGTTNIVNGGDTSAGSSFAVFAGGSLTIDGGGALTATGGNTQENSYGIYSYGGTIHINAGTVTAVGGAATNESVGICSDMDPLGSGGIIEISEGTVSATGGTAKGSSGISARGNQVSGGASILVSGGAVTALGGTSSEFQAFGICAKFGSITVSGAATTINATGGASDSNSYGIYADVNTAEGAGNGRDEKDGTITVSGGSITALGGAAGSSYGIFSIGAIAISESTVSATGGPSTGVGTTGIASEAGGITISGTATTVNATGGAATLAPENVGQGGFANSMGIYALGGDVSIGGNAVVNALCGTSESEALCGIHLNKSFQNGSGGILTINGNARVTAVGGIVVNMQNAFGGAALIIGGNAHVDIDTADLTEGDNLGISILNGYLMISENAGVTIDAGGGKYGSFGINISCDSESAGSNAGVQDGKLIITGGTLTVHSGTARNSRAIVAQGNIEIGGGTIFAQSGTATEETSTGIFSKGQIIINGIADITAKSGSAPTLSSALYANGGIAIRSAVVVLTPVGGGVSADSLYICMTAGVNGNHATDVHIAAAPAQSAAPQGQNPDTAATSGDNTGSFVWIVCLIAITAAVLCAGVILLVIKRKKS